jgi:hypothetical protein
VPSWESFSVAGYDPSALYDRWQESIDAKAKERAERNGTSESEERKKIIDAYERSSANAKKRNRR